MRSTKIMKRQKAKRRYQNRKCNERVIAALPTQNVFTYSSSMMIFYPAHYHSRFCTNHLQRTRLAQTFVQNDRDRVRKVQTPNFRIQHWYRDAILPVTFQQILGQSTCLSSENKTIICCKVPIEIG